MPVTYEFPRPAVTVDTVVFGVDDEGLKLLVLERDDEPFAGEWALPGGFRREGQCLADAAADVLRRKTGLADIFLEQLYTFDGPARDPRGDVISVAYFALVRLRDHAVRAATGAGAVRWTPVGALPALPFDHDAIVATALARLRGKVTYDPRVVFALMPPRFTLGQLQALYEAVLGRPIDKRNFRKKVVGQWGIVAETDQTTPSPAGPPSRLYAFDTGAYEGRAASGYQFLL